jgi:formylglycine-generating enzyme required for sulfatase activity
MPKYLNPKSQRGSVLLMILAGIATIGVLAMMGSTLLTTMISGNQRSSLSITTGQTLTQAAYTLTTEADKTGSYPVATAPTAWSGTMPSTAPAIGTANAVGLIPATSAAPKVDAWSSNFGYCTFTAVAQGNPVFAIISAGPDKVFQTTCTQAFAGTAQGDDGVRWKTATNVLQGVGGTVFFGDPVANLAALNALTTAHVGETRIALDTGYVYVNKAGVPGAGNWLLSGGGATGQGAQKTCPAGYVLVPEFTLPDSEYVPSFCVMQHDARKLANGIITADVTAFTTTGPMVNVTWRQAKALCSSADANLITEGQWLSISHQAVSVASNWSGGAVGSGTLARGWSANTAYGDTFTNTAVAPKNDATCLYNTGADTCGATGSVLYRRTLNLANGSVLWDISGNVWEWTDATLPAANRYSANGVNNWYAYSTAEGGFTAITTASLPINKVPPSGWNATQGMGRYYDAGTAITAAYCNVIDTPSDCAGNAVGYTDPYAAFLRGGGWYPGASSGPFALALNEGRSSTGASIGFRCTR